MNPSRNTIEQVDAYVDIHCHVPSLEGVSILSIDTIDFQTSMLNGGFYSLGIHPWFIERQNVKQAISKIALVLADPDMLAIGECGLDKTIATPFDVQKALFEQQIKLAEYSNKPLIIHCVHAFNELMQFKKNSRTHISWVIHGFNNKPVIAKSLLKQGFYLSMGKALLNSQSNAAQTLSMMPLQQLFLETDAAKDISISAIYVAAAKIVGIHPDDLQQQIIQNFKRVFLHD